MADLLARRRRTAEAAADALLARHHARLQGLGRVLDRLLPDSLDDVVLWVVRRGHARDGERALAGEWAHARWVLDPETRVVARGRSYSAQKLPRAARDALLDGPGDPGCVAVVVALEGPGPVPLVVRHLAVELDPCPACEAETIARLGPAAAAPDVPVLPRMHAPDRRAN